MSWPKQFESIDEIFKVLHLGDSSPKRIAKCVQQMSDYYIDLPDKQTPWEQDWVKVAQVGYYLPLNFLRAQRVINEANKWDYFRDLHSIVDFGSGLGAATWPLFFDSGSQKDWRSLHFCERSSVATNLHQGLMKMWGSSSVQKASHWTDLIKKNLVKEDALLVMSYVLTELDDLPDWSQDFGAILIIEPSTRQDGRKLMQTRKKLIDKKWNIWGPCTHQLACPLLEKSEKDWCHDRVHIETPGWFKEIEKLLPMRNQTLTMSYILAAKNAAPNRDARLVRTVGDSLPEKGKTRQLICRGPEREFLSWMHRDGKPPVHPRGDLIKLPDQLKVVGNELRSEKFSLK